MTADDTPSVPLRTLWSFVLLPGRVARIRLALVVLALALLSLKTLSRLEIPLWVTVMPLGLVLIIGELKKLFRSAISGRAGVSEAYRQEARVSEYARAVVVIGCLPTLRLTGVIDWGWWWLLAPIWVPSALFFVGLALVVGGGSVIGRDRALDVFDNALVMATLSGVGGLATVILAGLKLTGGVDWSWWVVFTPVAANLMFWLMATIGLAILFRLWKG